MQQLIQQVTAQLPQNPKLARMFAACFPNTWQTTIKRLPDDSIFVITGDIPAMWLRDSAAQVRPYLRLASTDPTIAEVLEKVVQRQVSYILHDPYANAFNQAPNGLRIHSDNTELSDWVWERKYEVDSLCYPLQLAYLLWQATGSTAHFTADFKAATQQVLKIWQLEQNHQNSRYHFERYNCPPHDTLGGAGRGTPVAVTGMTWTGFRPSDDSCTYGYLIPANAFAVVVLGYLAEIAAEVWQDADLQQEATELASTIRQGIEKYGRVQHPEYGLIYAYEVDGLGNYNLMDDANVPSLLSLPYLGYCTSTDPVYQNTRQFILSKSNPYFYAGSQAQGVGSPHTPTRYIWPIALIMQGLTAESMVEKEQILQILEATDAGTNLMHESFNADNPHQYTRPWFGWANSLFSELVLQIYG